MMKLRNHRILFPIILIIIASIASPALAEKVEKICAVVNDELITYSELKNAETELTRLLQQQYQGEELTSKIEEMKKGLLDQLIEKKMLLSIAKERNYDMSNDVEAVIKQIKEQNNLTTDEDLKAAIESQGINYDEWLKQLTASRLEGRLVFEEIGSKIKIDNASIIGYYKRHADQYTDPMQFSINCIYLDKAAFVTDSALKEKKAAIDAMLDSEGFLPTAKKHSQLQAENNYFLGEFKQGELDSKIEKVAIKLKKGEYSSWLETETAWYIVQLVSRTEPKLKEFKMVKDEIERMLRTEERNARLKEYLEKVKKESYIKIYMKDAK